MKTQLQLINIIIIITYWLEKVLKMISLYINAHTPLSLHRVYDSMLQRAQKGIDVQGDHFRHLL